MREHMGSSPIVRTIIKKSSSKIDGFLFFIGYCFP
jgi:hypothetical protein